MQPLIDVVEADSRCPARRTGRCLGRRTGGVSLGLVDGLFAPASAKAQVWFNSGLMAPSGWPSAQY
jgi:hypothetical protein